MVKRQYVTLNWEHRPVRYAHRPYASELNGHVLDIRICSLTQGADIENLDDNAAIRPS